MYKVKRFLVTSKFDLGVQNEAGQRLSFARRTGHSKYPKCKR